MHTSGTTLPVTTGRRDSAAKVFGLVGILGSPALLVAWLMGGLGAADPPLSVVAAQLVFLVGWYCSLVGLWLRSAAGTGPTRHLLWVQVAGVAVASTQEVQDLLLAPANRFNTLYDVAEAAWPLSVVFMIVVGVAVARAGVFSGWRRFPALACGLLLPLSIATMALLGQETPGLAFGILTAGTGGALGWSVVTSNKVP